MNMGANIARLRRERGMTQETLAEQLCVSPQTVSKWETAVSCPDVLLLPALADALGVSIDTLYGRNPQKALHAEDVYTHVAEEVRRTIVGLYHDPAADRPFEEELALYRKAMQADEDSRSVIESDREVLYFREKIGLLALRRPEEGWSRLFVQEENVEILRLLADGDFRRGMQVIISRRMLRFTLPTLAKAAGVDDADRLGEMLQSSGLFERRELLIDETPLVYYELTGGETKLYLLYACLTFAQELASYQAVHHCFFGNMAYFTP